MNSKTEENQIKKSEVLIWSLIILVTIVSIASTVHLKLSAPIQSIIWIFWLMLTSGLFYFTSQGKQFLEFANAAKVELQKVVWPARQETVQTTMIVMAMVAVAGFVLWAVDWSMMWLIGKITHLG